MKPFVYFLLSVIITITACKESASPTVSDVIDTNAQKNKVITDTKGEDTLANMDTTKIVVDSVVNIKVNNTLLKKKENNVYQALYNNWLRAYTESEHLPVALHITYIGTVMMGARGDIMDQVQTAQNNMKQYIAKDKYKKAYDSLNPDQQAGMRKQHAILFQRDFR